MNIAIDAMGGDNAPYEIVKGACLASEKFPNVTITLIGDENKINNCFEEFPKTANIQVVHTDVEVTMEDDPMVVMKEKSDSSMAIGLQMLKKGEVDAFLSAGNTGALHTASTLIVRKIKGIRRSGIASILPFDKPVLLLDSGANPTVTPEILDQWATLGSIYMKKMFKLSDVRVGLLNNGVEEHKGTPTVQEAHELLKKNKNINFVGNIESKEIPNSPCDLLITDGFTGNITLKALEGMGKFLLHTLKDIFTKNLKTKVSYLLIKNNISSLKNTFNASDYGGAPLLGIAKPVVKAHGSSDFEDIYCAVRQIIEYTESKVIEQVAEALK